MRQLVWNNFIFYLAFENSLCEDYITEKAWVQVYSTVPALDEYNGQLYPF